MKHPTTKSNSFKNFLLVVTISCSAMLLGCGDYYAYGIKRNQSETTLVQEDSYFITGEYEFESVLFRSTDGNITISLQHPIHPIPTPEKFISQIGIDIADPSHGSFEILSIEFFHQNEQAESIIPPVDEYSIEKEYYFYGLQYEAEELPPRVREFAKIRFRYDDIDHEIVFDEIVEKVKRWSKVSVLLASEFGKKQSAGVR